jgi:hypothetical protein
VTLTAVAKNGNFPAPQNPQIRVAVVINLHYASDSSRALQYSFNMPIALWEVNGKSA